MKQTDIYLPVLAEYYNFNSAIYYNLSTTRYYNFDTTRNYNAWNVCKVTPSEKLAASLEIVKGLQGNNS